MFWKENENNADDMNADMETGANLREEPEKAVPDGDTDGEENGGDMYAFVKKVEGEYDALYDKYLRVTAEYDNFRKRTSKEKEQIYFDATLDVLKTLLPVLDNIERALQFTETETEKVGEGLKMIHTQFMDSFNRLGVEEIKAEGEQFNPEVHNAVAHESDDAQPENTVTEVLQKGYIKGEKVIRPAMVRVVN